MKPEKLLAQIEYDHETIRRYIEFCERRGGIKNVQRRIFSVSDILQNVLVAFNLTTEQINKKTRDPYLVKARCAFHYILRHKTNLSLKEIGSQLDFSLDHSTIIHSILQAEKHIVSSTKTGLIIKKLLTDLH